MRIRRIAFLANVVISVLALALTGLARAQPIEWTKMIWVAGDLGPRTEQHAALMVEVKLDSQPEPALMQLDTGASGSVLYVSKTAPLDQADIFTALTGTVAGRSMQAEPFIKFPFLDPSGHLPLIGTIGVTFFEHRILLLDFVAQQAAILDKDENLPVAIARRLEFVPIDYRNGYRNGKVFIPVSLNGVEARDLFFDTGAAVTPIATTQNIWMKLTGRQPSDPANDHLAGETWGENITTIGAPLTGEMCIGKTCFAHPSVYFAPARPGGDSSSYGLIGLAPFDYRYSLALDLAHQRLGICKGSIVQLAPAQK